MRLGNLLQFSKRNSSPPKTQHFQAFSNKSWWGSLTEASSLVSTKQWMQSTQQLPSTPTHGPNELHTHKALSIDSAPVLFFYRAKIPLWQCNAVRCNLPSAAPAIRSNHGPTIHASEAERMDIHRPLVRSSRLPPINTTSRILRFRFRYVFNMYVGRKKNTLYVSPALAAPLPTVGIYFI